VRINHGTSSKILRSIKVCTSLTMALSMFALSVVSVIGFRSTSRCSFTCTVFPSEIIDMFSQIEVGGDVRLQVSD